MKNNFHYVAVLLDLLYSIEMEDEDLEELGLIAWNLIGNKETRMYRYSDCMDCDNSITLPCNILEGQIEAVTTSYEDWERFTNYTDVGDNLTSFIENNIEIEKAYQSPFYISGKLVKYEQVGDKLYFAHNYGRINILYRGILMDEDGLPQLTDKEATAIATYIAYVLKFKEGLVTNNNAIIQQANLLQAKWAQQCEQARVTYLNQNDMNNIIEIRNSFDRARYGKSFKPIR